MNGRAFGRVGPFPCNVPVYSAPVVRQPLAQVGQIETLLANLSPIAAAVAPLLSSAYNRERLRVQRQGQPVALLIDQQRVLGQARPFLQALSAGPPTSSGVDLRAAGLLVPALRAVSLNVNADRLEQLIRAESGRRRRSDWGTSAGAIARCMSPYGQCALLDQPGPNPVPVPIGRIANGTLLRVLEERAGWSGNRFARVEFIDGAGQTRQAWIFSSDVRRG